MSALKTLARALIRSWHDGQKLYFATGPPRRVWGQTLNPMRLSREASPDMVVRGRRISSLGFDGNGDKSTMLQLNTKLKSTRCTDWSCPCRAANQHGPPRSMIACEVSDCRSIRALKNPGKGPVTFARQSLVDKDESPEGLTLDAAGSFPKGAVPTKVHVET